MWYEGVDKPDMYVSSWPWIYRYSTWEGWYLFPCEMRLGEVYSVRFRMRLDMHAGLHSAYIGCEVLGIKHLRYVYLFSWPGYW
jgi:hypothetical protein